MNIQGSNFEFFPLKMREKNYKNALMKIALIKIMEKLRKIDKVLIKRFLTVYLKAQPNFLPFMPHKNPSKSFITNQTESFRLIDPINRTA